MALQPVRIVSPTSPIAVTLRSRIMVLLPSIAHTGARLLSPFDLASQTSLASQHESTGALPPHARMPRIRRRISATGISSITSGTMGSADRKSTRLNSSHDQISYAVFCLKKKKKYVQRNMTLYPTQHNMATSHHY